MNHRKPNRRVATSLPLATAAAVAALLAAGPADAAPAAPTTTPAEAPQTTATDQPGTPADAQPGTDNGTASTTGAAPSTENGAAPADNGTQQGDNDNGGKPADNGGKPGDAQPGTGNQTGTGNQPGVGKPNGNAPKTDQPGVSTPQPGVNTPQPGVSTPGATTNPPKPGDQGATPSTPSQPGVTAPRLAPLPVPGQHGQTVPGATGATPNQPGQPLQPGVTTSPKPADTTPQGVVTPGTTTTVPAGPQSHQNGTDTQTGDTAPQEQTPQPWNAPSLQAAPAAPVVAFTGPHTEIAADANGGAVLPGYVANTHHFSSLDGYVGTIGYSTPNGSGDAGISLDYTTPNQVKVSTYVHNSGAPDALPAEFVVDTTQANLAKAAVEGWIRQQPGGEAALQAAAQIGRLPQGDIAPVQVDVAGVTAEWGGTAQY